MLRSAACIEAPHSQPMSAGGRAGRGVAGPEEEVEEVLGGSRQAKVHPQQAD